MFDRWRKTKLQKRKMKKIKKERSMLQKQVFVGIFLLITIGLLGTGVWYGTRVDSLQITHVEVIGGYTIPHSVVEEKVRQRLIGSYFKLVPHTFRATYPKGAILENIYSLPRVKNVRIEVMDTQKIVVAFDEYHPVALWCADYDATECLFLDDTGYAFSQAPLLTGSAFARYIDQDHSPEAKQQGFSQEFITYAQNFSELLAEELDLYVTHVEKVGELDVLYTVSGGGVLKVSQRMDPEQSFKNLRSILGSEDFIHLQNGAFQYVDLRFGDKIFLNEKEESAVVATSSDISVE